MRISNRKRRQLQAELEQNREYLVRSIVLEPEAVLTREPLWIRHYDLIGRLAR